MRWKIGSYVLKYNPKSNSKSWSAEQGVTTNINGNTSNPNLSYNGSQDFTIELYDKPTYVGKEVVASGQYISVSEVGTQGGMHILSDNGTFDVRSFYDRFDETKTIVAGTTTLPVSYPIAIASLDYEIAFLYKEGGKAIILITDNNGVANRKYTYDSVDGDISNISSLCFDSNAVVYAVNPYGKVYKIDVGTGLYSSIYQFEDYNYNTFSDINKYSSVISIKKQGSSFFGVMKNKRDIVVFNQNANVVSTIETGMNNVVDVSYSSNGKSSHIIIGNSVRLMFVNTCRLDIGIIKGLISSGPLEIYDELGMPSLISVKDMRVTRNRNMKESRYELSLSCEIIYSNKTFNDSWFNYNRSI